MFCWRKMNTLPVVVIPASCWPESLLIILGKMPAKNLQARASLEG